MKKIIFIFALALLVSFESKAQDSVFVNKSCSVIVLGKAWLIKSYDRNQKIVMDRTSKGLISVHETGDIAEHVYKKNCIPFMISILRKSDETTVMFSGQIYKQCEISDVIKKCQNGDKIIIMLMDGEAYALPHHQIEVIADGC